MRIALGIEYDGTIYAGWQRQPNVLHIQTIQAQLEAALSKIADHPVTTFCAGRTDGGVHAKGQVVHFETEANRPESAWTLGTNSRLPADICVRWMKQMPSDFHARFSAQARRYAYLIDTRPVRSALLRHQVTWFPRALNVDWMNEAACYLVGEHDFSAFRSADCQSHSTLRHVHFIELQSHGAFIAINIKANAFLHHMVRNIVGVLLKIGEGKAAPQWVKHVLESKDRQQAAETAPATGLYLTHVEYPAEFDLPNENSNHVLYPY